MINIENLSKSFGDKLALDNLNLKVKRGEIFGFLGPNGAGKTTTIKMIVGMLKQDKGHILIDGIDTLKDPIEAKKKFAFVPDNPDVYETMTGRQYLNFIGDVFEISLDKREENIKKYQEIFEMKENLDLLISSYSHGMKQKIVLMGALIHEPDLLILDEPMVGLDAKSSFRLKNIMRQLCDSGKSVFFSTHVMEVAEKVCDRIAIINKGKLIAVGSLEEIKNQADDEGSLEKIFLELTE
ncbi:ABC-2 type transport system ATP-binding protein [Peptoniphilus koenoeneniae]|uniref:ABC-2 type transport system ATP-binding protein n=1 Tax=Peptoniphilus koenoeneniae TaxID=507751 RepID=A0ABU0AWN6_9FIRM|nr:MULTISPECIES: ABC transporter ATP-binding protein [Peptoniphilus]ERT57438.1 ABC transporter, ATP-binding protein [Peptoniphilus sp. BV3C26]MDQ0275430.1 ABC-2 type transport system ATP-binding protein [Peptoniphilus koenoeneniae]